MTADPGEILRARGLRVTPQRRAILGAFSGGAAEHLAADEIHALAAAVVPELGRGTVYAVLAELTELGILAARGSPEPVRYELQAAPHQHFRCRLCLRLFDVDIPEPALDALRSQGFTVEQVTVTADGICAECVAYDRGLRAGARSARTPASSDLPEGIAAAVVETPVGSLTMAATDRGLVRAVFDDHADVPALREVIRSRRGSRAARGHLEAAKGAIEDYFAGRAMRDCEIDWDAVPDAATLRAAQAARRGEDVSYDALDTEAGAERLGRALGANPLAVLVPCHRVTRGTEISIDYVGGGERRLALRGLERAQDGGPDGGG